MMSLGGDCHFPFSIARSILLAHSKLDLKKNWIRIQYTQPKFEYLINDELTSIHSTEFRSHQQKGQNPTETCDDF